MHGQQTCYSLSNCNQAHVGTCSFEEKENKFCCSVKHFRGHIICPGSIWEVFPVVTCTVQNSSGGWQCCQSINDLQFSCLGKHLSSSGSLQQLLPIMICALCTIMSNQSNHDCWHEILHILRISSTVLTWSLL